MLAASKQSGGRAMSERLRAIVEFDRAELEALEPPKGFGRD
jgi:hypothetical protein